MGQSEFIAALDLGSSKIIAMAGRKNEQGLLSIIASEKEESDTCIRRGCVHNMEETATKIKRLTTRLNYKLNPKIEKIYVGIGGQSLRTETYTVTKAVNGAIINDQLLQSLYDECSSYQPEFAEILEIVSPEYYLDGRLEPNPKGIQCSTIEGRFKLVLGRPSLKRTLQKSVEEKTTLQIAGYFISPIATAAAVLNETEKELGCALIEFGAGITYLSVYKNGLLRYLATIPLGGKAITKDICHLNVLEKEAEELKVNFGSALTEFDNSIKVQTAKLAEGSNGIREIKLNDLNNIIEARVDEILANVLEQINISGYASNLGTGIVITGGGAAMKNIIDSIKHKTGLEVRMALIKKSLVNQAIDWAQDCSNSQVIGLLSLGNENCAKAVEKTAAVAETLFTEDEIEVVKPPVRPAKEEKPKDPKKEGGKSIFGKLTEKFDGFSKSLFEDE